MTSSAEKFRQQFLEVFGQDPRDLLGIVRELAGAVRALDEKLEAQGNDVTFNLQTVANSGISTGLFGEQAIEIVPTANPDEVEVRVKPGFSPSLLAARMAAPVPVGVVTLPRPAAGLTEYLGGSSPSAPTDAAPTQTLYSRHRWSAYTVEVDGVAANPLDYSYDDETGELVVLDTANHPDPALWSIVGTPAGYWTASVCARIELVAGVPTPELVALPGYTRYPDASRRDLGDVPSDHCQVGAVFDLVAGAALILTNQIDSRRQQIHGDSGLVSAIDGHDHAGFPGDGAPAVLTEVMIAGEAITNRDAVARFADGTAYIADNSIANRMHYCGIALNDAAIGERIIVQTHGLIEHDAWSWTMPGAPYLYLAAAGALQEGTSGIVSGELIQRIGKAKSATQIMLRPDLRLLR